MEDLSASTAKLVNYMLRFGYDKWKYALPDDRDSLKTIDKLVYTDPDKFTALEIARSYSIKEYTHKRRYYLKLDITTVNQRIIINNLHNIISVNEFNLLIARFDKECAPNLFQNHSKMCNELGL